ncbi:MAG: hypothetical protein PVJ08_08145 [Dehalococcoidia bacterium]|jgi:hypothetical protein
MNGTTEMVTDASAITATLPDNIIWIYFIIIGLLVLLPSLVDMFLSYHSLNKAMKMLGGEADKEKQAKRIEDILRAPKGITGLSRATMALTVIAILGIATVHLLLTRASGDDQIISNVLSMLGGLIAAIVGFYFGGRAKDKAPDEKTDSGR